MKRLIGLLLSAVFVFVLFGCTETAAISGDSSGNPTENSSRYDPSSQTPASSNESSDGSGAIDPADYGEFLGAVMLNALSDNAFSAVGYDDAYALTAYNGFSMDFFKTVTGSDKNSNVCLSPLSAYMAFSLCFSGAQGQTLTEFENAFGLEKAEAMEFCRAIYARFMQREYRDENTKVNLANSVWIDDKVAGFVKNDYLSGATDYFNAPVFKSDFRHPSTVDAINDWCSENTDGLIKEIIKKLDVNTIMALINALLVEVNWGETYEYTLNDVFTAYDGTEKEATYLPRQIGTYYHDDMAKAFKMPLMDGFSFVGILPEKNVGIDAYLNGLTAEKIKNLLSRPDYSADVKTTIPKFNIDYEVDLSGVMKEMGITTAFNSSVADFKPMVEIPGANVYIGAAKQKTHFELDEKGIKAAAVTFIAAVADSVPEPKPIVEIYLDRPFVYMLVDNATNMPLFIGTIKTL